MLQNVTPLRRSGPWPPNLSHEHVFCTAPATENASLQIIFKCPMPAIVFGNATKPSRVAHFWQCAESLAPATQNHISTFKTGPSMWCFLYIWLRNVLRTTACTFSISQLPKVVREWCALYILTWIRASRHNGVSTSESGPNLVCFVHFWLGNVLHAATACNFSSRIWQHGSAPAALTSLLFDPPEPQIIGKAANRDFATFSRTCIFFLLTLSLLWSSLFFSSLLWIFPPLLFHLSILSKVWLLNFLRPCSSMFYQFYLDVYRQKSLGTNMVYQFSLDLCLFNRNMV